MAAQLIDRSLQARMTVVAIRGLGAVGRGLPGVVTTALARHAHCPSWRSQLFEACATTNRPAICHTYPSASADHYVGKMSSTSRSPKHPAWRSES